MKEIFKKAEIKKRKKGQNSIFCSAYNSGSRLKDYVNTVYHDFTYRVDVTHTDLLLPSEADSDYFADRETLWKEIEQSDNREDAVVAFSVEFALNESESLEDWILTITDFAKCHYLSKGLAVDYAIHEPELASPHAHLLVTPRVLSGQSVSKHPSRSALANPA